MSNMNSESFKQGDLILLYAPPNLRSVMPGNKVMLRSGGPCMIVEEYIEKEDSAVCKWNGEGTELNRATFPLACLTCYGAL
jgi:uncharacterized protein YodC (DUF2158 family)